MSKQMYVMVLGNGLHSIPTLAVLSGNTLGALVAVAAMSSVGVTSPFSVTFIVTTYLLAYPLLMLANWLYLRESRRQPLTFLQSGLFAAMCVLTMWTVDYGVYKAFSGAAQAPQKLSSATLPLRALGFSSLTTSVPPGPRANGSTHYRLNFEH